MDAETVLGRALAAHLVGMPPERRADAEASLRAALEQARQAGREEGRREGYRAGYDAAQADALDGAFG